MNNHQEINAKMGARFKETTDFSVLELDREAVASFAQEVEKKTKTFATQEERLRWMIEHDYYIDFFQQYAYQDVIDLFEQMNRQAPEFQSYMAISKFYRDYALKTDDKSAYLESYGDRIAVVALELGRGDIDTARRIADAMIKQEYQPATPTFLNAGRSRRGELVSCFLMEIDDTLNSIYYAISTSAQLSKIGGGVALNLSKIRSRGEEIKGVKNASSGVLPVMKLLEDTFSYANQLGQRQGSGAVYLNIFHYDLEEFLSTKKINADEKARMQTLSIGLIVPSKFFSLARENQPFYVFKPYTVWKEYGKHLDDMDMDEMYDVLVANPRVEKKALNARKLLVEIAKTQLESGYPYIFYRDNANQQHALKGIGQVKMSNLCTEIMQLMETSVINDYGQPDEIRRDISCNLGSLNIVNVMEHRNIKGAVYAGMDALTAVSDMSEIANAPGVKKANQELHSVGLGALNLHGFLAKNKIPYDSEEARDFVNLFFMMVNYYSLSRSMEIARERQTTFKDFHLSEYATGEYFTKYTTQSFVPQTEKVRQLFAGIEIPTVDDWQRLAHQVQQHGLYHAYRLAIAPTGSISYIQNATASVMPITQQIERRTYGNSETFFPMPFLSQQTFWYYKTAYNMNQYRLIDLVATIQQHVDQGISCTLFVNHDVSTRELARLYIYGHQKGLKSLYYTRTNRLTAEECVTCVV